MKAAASRRTPKTNSSRPLAAETLAELRAEKDRMPVAQLIHKALERTGYDAILLAEFLGERKLANLHKLIEQARQFDAGGIFTLADFVTQLAQFVARQPDEPLAATQPESINAVRLMSIHQSKGLEFPIVVVVDVDRPRRSFGEGVAFTTELGPMVRVSDCTSGYDLFQRAERDEELAELTRLLYVAATRAGDYLILVQRAWKISIATPGPVDRTFAAALRSRHGNTAWRCRSSAGLGYSRGARTAAQGFAGLQWP